MIKIILTFTFAAWLSNGARAGTALVTNLGEASARVCTANGEALRPGCQASVGLTNASPSDLQTAFQAGGLSAVEALLQPFGGAFAMGAGASQTPGRFEMERSKTMEPGNVSGRLVLLVLDAPGAQSATQLLLVGFDSLAPDSIGGVATYRSFHLKDGEVILGAGSESGLIMFPFPSTGYAAWIQEKFASSPTAADLMPSADPDQDGCANIDEYAFGSEPDDANSACDIIMLGEAGETCLQYTRRRNDPQARFIVECRHDLTQGEWELLQGTTTLTPVSDELELARMVISPSIERLFVRVRVVFP